MVQAVVNLVMVEEKKQKKDEMDKELENQSLSD